MNSIVYGLIFPSLQLRYYT